MTRSSTRWIAQRLAQMLLVLWVVATLLFLIFRLMPGNPLAAYIDPNFTADQQQALIHEFGLDLPLWQQYLIFLRASAAGSMGQSFFYHAPVAQLVWEALPNTLILVLGAVIIAFLIGAPAGAFLAWKRGTAVETAGISLALAVRAAPEFWVGMILLAVFSFSLRWFPTSGTASPGAQYASLWRQLTSPDFLRHLALPLLTLVLYLQGLPLLLMRSNMLDVMEEEFIVMARMKGLPEGRILLRHAARNALLPVVTAFALVVGYSLQGYVVVENVFSWPGLGRLLVKAVAAKDYPLAQGAFLLIAALAIFMNLAADLFYTWLDPRVSYAKR
ncbi:MAG: ABC transporter permease [Bacillati bacterium ANGP1]|uniref:ABC transporter permease n=1 Tax=Candidatus Segetimicrobium genomatis TaxID=2569760 RepID=A0A537J5E4_9BACT|nr:MAG: ABC transporter permease [Terrabacteria group bacterium ANGP1]